MGHIEKRDGRYRARYADATGRRHSQTFTRKADAERFVREQQVEIERGGWIDPRGADASVAEWVEEFLLLCRRLAPSTQVQYRRDLTKYVVPRFGSYRLGRLPADEIENWLNDEIAAGIAPSSVHRHYRMIRRMLHVAVEKEKLLRNPCDRVTPPSVPKTEMTFLNWEEAVDLAEVIDGRYRALVYLAVDSGMRWSELVGLRRSRLDLRRRKVRVTEQLVRLGAGQWDRRRPKSDASVRSITISPFTAEVLEEHVKRYSASGPDGFVFPNRADNPLIESSFHTHYWKPALATAGIACRFHDLRHTSVALAIGEGAHPKAIQSRMGHASISITLDRYGHLFPELDEALAVSLGERFRAALSVVRAPRLDAIG